MQNAKTPWKLNTETKRRFDSETGEPIESTNAWIKDADGFSIALIATTFDKHTQVGNMMATAPEMLEILMELEKEFMSSGAHPLHDKAISIIKKAKGDS
jgi:hypothetical protein